MWMTRRKIKQMKEEIVEELAFAIDGASKRNERSANVYEEYQQEYIKSSKTFHEAWKKHANTIERMNAEDMNNSVKLREALQELVVIARQMSEMVDLAKKSKETL